MKKQTIIFAGLLPLFIIPMLAFSQPPHAKAWGKHKKWKEDRHEREYREVRYVPVERTRVYYEYYPSLNVYFNVATRQYWYPRGGSWVQVNTLPQTYVVTNARRQKVWCYSDEPVWVNRHYHSDLPVLVAPPPRPGVNVSINARF